MKRFMTARWLCIPSVAAAVLFRTGDAMACAACYGAADSPMTKGMNMAVFSLLIVVVAVMISVSAFFLFLRKRLRTMHRHGLASSSGAFSEGLNR